MFASDCRMLGATMQPFVQMGRTLGDNIRSFIPPPHLCVKFCLSCRTANKCWAKAHVNEDCVFLQGSLQTESLRQNRHSLEPLWVGGTCEFHHKSALSPRSWMLSRFIFHVRRGISYLWFKVIIELNIPLPRA